MLRNTFFALAVLGLAATSQAAVMISQAGTPTVDKPGFTTWVLTASSDGAAIAGFDFFGTVADPLGFFGPMGQVIEAPFVNSSVFNDSNSFFPILPSGAKHVSQDSQFMFNATGANSVLVPTGFAEESATSLRASFALSAPVQSVAFAQLSLEDGLEPLEFRGRIGFAAGSGEAQALVTGIVPPGGDLDPVGSIVGDGSFGTVVRGTLQQRSFSIQSTGDADLTLGVPSITGPFSIVGTLPTVLVAGDSADFQISFNTAGLGIDSVHGGLFSLDSNAGPLSADLSGQVIPEPSTFALLGLALVGMIGYTRRRS